MSGAGLALDVHVQPFSALALPPQCERIAQSYVGDWCFSLVRDPRNRMLFLSSPFGFHQLDPQQLLATYATTLRAWDREQGWLDGRMLARAGRSRAADAREPDDRGGEDSAAADVHRRQAPSVRQVAPGSRRAAVPGRSRRRRRAGVR